MINRLVSLEPPLKGGPEVNGPVGAPESRHLVRHHAKRTATLHRSRSWLTLVLGIPVLVSPTGGEIDLLEQVLSGSPADGTASGAGPCALNTSSTHQFPGGHLAGTSTPSCRDSVPVSPVWSPSDGWSISTSSQGDHKISCESPIVPRSLQRANTRTKRTDRAPPAKR